MLYSCLIPFNRSNKEPEMQTNKIMKAPMSQSRTKNYKRNAEESKVSSERAEDSNINVQILLNAVCKKEG